MPAFSSYAGLGTPAPQAWKHVSGRPHPLISRWLPEAPGSVLSLDPANKPRISHVTFQRALDFIFQRAPGSGAVNSIFFHQHKTHVKRSQLQVTDNPTITNTRQCLKCKIQRPWFNGETAPSLWLNYWSTEKQEADQLMKERRDKGLGLKCISATIWLFSILQPYIIWLRSSVTSVVSTARICLKLIAASITEVKELFYYDEVKLYVPVGVRVCFIHIIF